MKPVSATSPNDLVDVVTQHEHTQIVRKADEEKFVVELTENIEQYSPPLIVQPLQPVAVHEGEDFCSWVK